MFSSSVLCLLAGFSQYFLVSASPTTLLDRVEPRQVKPRCNNGIPFDPACWTILKIPEYYQNWTETHGQNCSDLGYGDFFDYNVPGCFTALVTGKSYPCNTTGTSDSDELGLCAIDPLSLQNYSPQDAYVLHGIYGVWKWFQSISKQIRNAPPALSKGAQIIADQFDPPSEPLQFSPEFIWLSLAAGVLDTRLPASNSTFFQAFEERARTDPAFGDLRTTVIAFQNVTVTGYLGSMIPYEWDPKTAFNGSIVLDYGTILDQGLQSLMTDPYRFLAVTINGSFIDDIDAPTANTTTLFRPFYYNILRQYIHTYANTTNILSTVSRNTDPYLFHKYNHDKTYPISCAYYEPGNICSTWYHNNATNNTYSLLSTPLHKSNKNYYQAMRNIFDAGLLTGEEIFDWLDLCKGAFTKGTREVLLSDTGRTVDCSLFLDVPLAVFDGTCGDGRDCEFENELENQVISTEDWTEGKCFPAGYLGDRRGDGGMKPC